MTASTFMTAATWSYGFALALYAMVALRALVGARIGLRAGLLEGALAASALWAAGALIAAKVTPVVTVHISMGGDNHSDSNLQAESDQHVSGITAMNKLLMNDTANGVLASLGLLDQVTFAFWNVFGRNLAGISKVTSRTGRDHWGNHNVSVMVIQMWSI